MREVIETILKINSTKIEMLKVNGFEIVYMNKCQVIKIPIENLKNECNKARTQCLNWKIRLRN